ncbi:MAG: RtcB family protein, partial [Bacteroidota bacterium]|nr:RtcB family protein [Bacteroidota bacterium]
MSKLKLKGKEIRAIGYPEGPVISIAMNVMEKNYKHEAKEDVMNILKQILAAPVEFENDAVLGLIARQLLPKPAREGLEIALNSKGIGFAIFGIGHIEQGAINQMEQAAKLPVARAAALMPDAHAGYGLPIGGVLATENAVIPYGVGVDIGCRMCLSVFDIDPAELLQRESYFSRELSAATLFGGGRQFEINAEHEITDRPEFDAIPLLKGLQGKAAMQLGSSGSGNHFVEFGTVEVTEKEEVLGIAPGTYLGLLSHSGSRALGASIADHYTRIAKEKRRL